MKICIFCSANDNIDSDFFKLTEQLGRWIAENGHTLVFGGCDLGLMECVAQSVKQHGGNTIGVIPKKVEERGRVSSFVDQRIDCDNLNQRKQIMMEESDVFIALPGGIGTLDEIFTVAASATIGYHDKRVILYDMKGFWTSLLAMLNDLGSRNLLRGNYQKYIIPAKDLDEIQKLLSI